MAGARLRPASELRPPHVAQPPKSRTTLLFVTDQDGADQIESLLRMSP